MLDKKQYCKICSEEVLNKKHFWIEHKISETNYYLQHYNKRDLLTDEIIPFKNAEQYLNSDFVDKTNFQKWLKSQSLNDQKEYCLNLLKNRIFQKKLTYTPSQIELRSLPFMPGVITFDKLFEDDGGYYKVCQAIGLRERFENHAALHSYIHTQSINDEILIDTREQKMLIFDHPSSIATLSYGDYTLNNKNNIYIERKSLSDFISSFSSGIDRLHREIEKAYNNNAYLVIIIEENLSKSLTFNNLSWISKKIKVKPDFVFHNVREIYQKYINCQFLFCDGRRETARLVKKILFNSEICKKIDLELVYELGLL